MLPGRIKDPSEGIAQAIKGEELGLGTLWLSERWGNKDVGAICGALSQVSPSTYIAAGTTHFLTRHPVVLASMAMTLQSLRRRVKSMEIDPVFSALKNLGYLEKEILAVLRESGSSEEPFELRLKKALSLLTPLR